MKLSQLITYIKMRKIYIYYKFSVIECLNMQIMHYLIKYALICIYKKPPKSEYWIKPGSKLFFHCVHILDEIFFFKRSTFVIL